MQPGPLSPSLSDRSFPCSWTSSPGNLHVAEGSEALDPALPHNLRFTGPVRAEWLSCCQKDVHYQLLKAV